MREVPEVRVPTRFRPHEPMPRKPKTPQVQSPRSAPPLDSQPVLQALATVMGPIVQLLLNSGVDYTRFAAELKSVFVEEAVAQITQSGQASTDSAISLLSGVHRKDVRNWRLTGQLAPTTGKGIAVSAQVFAQWAAHPPYATRRGKPRTLARTGPEPSFETLVRTVTHDIHPFTVLQELIRLGMASVQDQRDRELVVPAQADFVAPAGSHEALELLAANLADHALAAVSNVLGGRPHLEQSVFAAGISAESAERLNQLARTLWSRTRAEIIEEATRLYEADKDRAGAATRVRFGSYFWSAPWTPPQSTDDTKDQES